MPSFSGIEVTTTADVEFEVFCAQCGAGLCGNCSTRESIRRGFPQAVIEPCEKCLESAREEGRNDSSSEADRLEDKISDLEREIARYENAEVVR